MVDPIVVDVNVRTVGPNQLHNEHYGSRKSRVRRERAATREALKGVKLPELPVVVTIVRCAAMLMDSDSLAVAAKAIRDEVSDALGVDDSPRETRVRWRYAQCLVREPCIVHERNGRARRGFRVWTQIMIKGVSP